MAKHTYRIGPIEVTADTKTEARRLAEEQAAKILWAAEKTKLYAAKLGEKLVLCQELPDGTCGSSRTLELPDGVTEITFFAFGCDDGKESGRKAMMHMADTRDYESDGEIPTSITDKDDRKELLRRSRWQRAYVAFQDLGASDPHRLACDFVDVKRASELTGRGFVDVLREGWATVLEKRYGLTLPEPAEMPAA